MLAWFSSLADGVFRLGYAGIVVALVIEGFGSPFPGDAMMAFYGFAAAEGRFQIGYVLLCGVAGYAAGTVCAYWLARRYGGQIRNRLERLILLNARSMTRATRMIDRYGPLLLVFGRFLPGVRSVSSYVAGFSGMELRPYLLYTFLGSFLWCSFWTGLGYWLGENTAAVLTAIQSTLARATVVLVVAAACIWWLRRQRAR